MSTTIERLKQLESLIHYDAGKGPKSGWSPCDDIRFKEALGDAWPKLLAVVEEYKVFINYCQDRFTWSAPPDEWEYASDAIMLRESEDALAALEK